MTTQPKPTRFTADKFIAWAAEQPRGRFELAGGQVVAMAPECMAHTRAKFDAAIALRAAIAARGLGCEALIDGPTVRIDEATVYEPDALVRCGPRLPGDTVEAPDPVIVVEVVSPSSRGIDSGAKLMGYFRLPSVRHHLVLDAETRAVVHHRRDERGDIATAILRDRSLSLDPPGLVLQVKDLFATV
jgi:Uma2 family endonuclease